MQNVMIGYRANSAILCSHFEQDFYVAGGYDQNIYHFDPRSGGILCKKRYHAKPILCLAAVDNYIITGSEDSTISLYDRRASAVIKKQKVRRYSVVDLHYSGHSVYKTQI